MGQLKKKLILKIYWVQIVFKIYFYNHCPLPPFQELNYYRDFQIELILKKYALSTPKYLKHTQESGVSPYSSSD